ncbi:hypothetical protein, partial [Thiolapillus sp.]|uniref:hypothetical protein n=1 Tax=Thiolapillus sp. TaxID=2017437 RepID=UPI0025F826BE
MFSLWRKARRENSAASRLLGSTSLRFALHGWQRSHTPYYDDPDHGTSGLIDPTSHHSCAAKDQRGALRIDRVN